MVTKRNFLLINLIKVKFQTSQYQFNKKENVRNF